MAEEKVELYVYDLTQGMARGEQWKQQGQQEGQQLHAMDRKQAHSLFQP